MTFKNNKKGQYKLHNIDGCSYTKYITALSIAAWRICISRKHREHLNNKEPIGFDNVMYNKYADNGGYMEMAMDLTLDKKYKPLIKQM